MTGINAEVRVEDPSACQVAPISRQADAVTSVTRSAPDEDGTVTEEFALDGDYHDSIETPETELVFSQGNRKVYRFSREADQGCICEIVERSGCTVRQVRCVNGALVVTFFATDVETIRSIVGDLREAHDGVRLRRLTRSAEGEDDHTTTIIDLGALTDRQREVLDAAYEHGYFEHPRGGSAADVADALDIAVPTFTEHLAAAQRNLLEELLHTNQRSTTAKRGRI
ncbi:MAG: putative DNA binding protein [Halobacteriales archaeon]|jgi:predicted DNA binding protein